MFAARHQIICGLFYLTAGLHLTGEGGDTQRTVEVLCREDHSLTLDTHDLSWGEVGDEEHILATQIFGLKMLGDTAEDGAVGATAIIDGETKELLRFLHLLTLLDMTHTDIELLKLLEVDRVLDRRSLVVVGKMLRTVLVLF